MLENDEGSDQSSGFQVDITSPKEGPDQCASTSKELEDQRGSVLHREEREIEKIVGKRLTRKGYEYKVRWRDTWLPGSELKHTLELMQQFEKKWLSRAAKTSTGEDRQR